MRSEPPRGISAVEVQVSLMETSQNTIFFLPPILKPTRNYSHTYNQMLQSAAVGEMGEGPTASHRLVFLRRRTHGARLHSRWHRHSDSARSRAGVVPRMPEQEPSGQFALIYGLFQQPNPFNHIPSLLIKYLIINSKFLDYKDFFLNLNIAQVWETANVAHCSLPAFSGRCPVSSALLQVMGEAYNMWWKWFKYCSVSCIAECNTTERSILLYPSWARGTAGHCTGLVSFVPLETQSPWPKSTPSDWFFFHGLYCPRVDTHPRGRLDAADPAREMSRR